MNILILFLNWILNWMVFHRYSMFEWIIKIYRPGLAQSHSDNPQTTPRHLSDSLQTPQNMAHFDQFESTWTKGSSYQFQFSYVVAMLLNIFSEQHLINLLYWLYFLTIMWFRIYWKTVVCVYVSSALWFFQSYYNKEGVKVLRHIWNLKTVLHWVRLCE